jgi:hypothetical protein
VQVVPDRQWQLDRRVGSIYVALQQSSSQDINARVREPDKVRRYPNVQPFNDSLAGSGVVAEDGERVHQQIAVLFGFVLNVLVLVFLLLDLLVVLLLNIAVLFDSFVEDIGYVNVGSGHGWFEAKRATRQQATAVQQQQRLQL